MTDEVKLQFIRQHLGNYVYVPDTPKDSGIVWRIEIEKEEPLTFAFGKVFDGRKIINFHETKEITTDLDQIFVHVEYVVQSTYWEWTMQPYTEAFVKPFFVNWMENTS